MSTVYTPPDRPGTIAWGDCLGGPEGGEAATFLASGSNTKNESFLYLAPVWV